MKRKRGGERLNIVMEPEEAAWMQILFILCDLATDPMDLAFYIKNKSFKLILHFILGHKHSLSFLDSWKRIYCPRIYCHDL